MAQEVRLQGRTYSDVPSILLPDSNNVFHPFTDVSDTTATAADVATGKYFYLADGTKTQGTSSGGGGRGAVTQDQDGYLVLDDDAPAPSGGLEYEEGTFTVESDTQTVTIRFNNSHTSLPMFCMAVDDDISTTPPLSYSVCYLTIWETYAGTWKTYVGYNQRRYVSSGDAAGGSAASVTSSNVSTLVTTSSYAPQGTSSGYYWRASRSYKWIAVWRPTP